MSTVLVPSVQTCIEVFGNVDGRSIHQCLISSEFRSATSLKKQIDFVKSVRPSITVREITKLLSISNGRYYNAIGNNENQPPKPVLPPSQRLLTDDDEEEIIANILLHQMQHDFLDGKRILELTAEIYERRTGPQKEISCDWLMDF